MSGDRVPFETEPSSWSVRDGVGTCPTVGCGLLDGHGRDCVTDMGATDEPDGPTHVMQLTAPPRQPSALWWPRALCRCGWESDECATVDDARDAHDTHVASATLTAVDRVLAAR